MKRRLRLKVSAPRRDRGSLTSTSGRELRRVLFETLRADPPTCVRFTGENVPQWIGMANRGFNRRSDCAARSGSRCPGRPSTPSRRRVAGRCRSSRRARTSRRRDPCRRRSRCAASRRQDTRGGGGPEHESRPSCSAGVAWIVTSPMRDLVADVDLAHVGELAHQPAGAHGHDRGSRLVRAASATAGRGGRSEGVRRARRRSPRARSCPSGTRRRRCQIR